MYSASVKAKEMPRLLILRLGNDHTVGTKKGGRTPRAMVAENDRALGRLVEAISRSRFWPESAILVLEDASRFGLTHHRAIGTEQQLLTGLSAGIKSSRDLCTAERAIGERSAVFAGERDPLRSTLIDDQVAEVSQPIDV